MAVEQRRNIANASLSGAAVSAPQHALTIFSFAAGLNAEQRFCRTCSETSLRLSCQDVDTEMKSTNTISVGDGTGAITRDYIFFNGKRIGFTSLTSGNTHYYYDDHLGSSSVISDASGSSIEWEADYFPFGGKHVLNNFLDTFFLFTGWEFDYETGYYYAGARHQSPTLGRFMSPDGSAKPVAVPYADLLDPQTLNLYSYVRNNPLSNIDPDGHKINLTGDKEQRDEEQRRLVANASKKGEAALFKTVTDKDGKTRLVLDKGKAAAFKGSHSMGFNMLVQAIDAKPTISVEMTNTDSHVLSHDDRTKNITVGLDQKVAGVDVWAPMRDSNGKEISNPFSIIAGHEVLGHARLEVLGVPGWDLDGSGSKTFQIENQLRKEQGLPSRPDDVP
jgi:RHS repeat-associated protein